MIQYLSLQDLAKHAGRTLSIGLEIGDRTLRVAWRAGRQGGTWQYLHTLRTGDDNTTLLVDLQRLLRPLARTRFSARLFLASPTSSVQDCHLEAADPKQLREALQEQLPKLLPFALETASYQYRVRQQQRTNDHWTFGLTLAACDATVLNEQLEVLWRAGWAPSSVVPPALALLTAAKAAGALSAEPTALVDLGDRRTTIALVAHGGVVYARDVTLGGEHLVEALMSQVSVGERTVNLARADAEQLQETYGFPLDTASAPPGTGAPPAAPSAPAIPLSTYQAMLQPLLEQLAGEMRRTMTFGAQTVQAPTPTRILLSGAGARWPNADAWFAKQLGIATSRMDCGRLLGPEGASAAVVCGLAAVPTAARLDLQPPAARQRAQFLSASVRVWQACLVMVLVTWTGAGWWQMRHRAIRQEVARLQTRLAEFEPVTAAQAAAAAYHDIIAQLGEQRGVRLAWFRELADGFPSPVRLKELAVAPDGDVRMTGEAQERDQTPEAYVSTLANWLEERGTCRQVQLGSSRQADPSGSLVEFTMDCRWR